MGNPLQRARGISLRAFGIAWTVLNGALAASCAAPADTNSVVLPFEFRRGHVMISARVAHTNAQPFILDTGYSISMLPPGLGDALGLRRTGRVTIVGIAGEEEAGTFEGPPIHFDTLAWSSRRVGSFPPSTSERSRRHEGILGSGFFRRFVVEIDRRTKTVTLREPGRFEYVGRGEILPLRFRRGSSTPILAASLQAPGGTMVSGEFEVDIGCDSCLCVAQEFTEKHRLVPADAHSSRRTGVGGGTRTRAGKLALLQLGAHRIDRPSAEFFEQGSPAGRDLAGHIGIEAFQGCKLILDYSRQRLILEPYSPKAR